MAFHDLVIANLLSPPVLAFCLGLLVTLLKSDLRLPESIYQAFSFYLLFAIGLKGGGEISAVSFSEIGVTSFTAILLGSMTPLVTYVLFKKIAKYSLENTCALAAHYGSVSAVTFIACLEFMKNAGVDTKGYFSALVALMEIPGIVVALSLYQLKKQTKDFSWHDLGKVLIGKSVVLLAGGFAIGFLSGQKGLEPVAPFFVTPFRGVITLFLLEMGVMAGQRLRDLKKTGLQLVFLATCLPLINGILSVFLCKLLQLPFASTVVLATLAASSSYIAAPAAVRDAIPDANPTIYLTASLGITFPFNLVVGFPLYFHIAQLLYN